MAPTHPTEDRRGRTAADLASRHAISLERLAVVLPTAWLVPATFVTAGDPTLTLAWVGVATVSALTWGLLRTLAIVLHLRAEAAWRAEAGASRPDATVEPSAADRSGT